MNNTLEKEARKILKGLLEQLPEKSFDLFKRMYCPKNLEASLEQACELIDSSKIDWAITQCENTLNKD